ncbi:MAG: tetratricopeptide repeat protein [Anaerolineae bacterium]
MQRPKTAARASILLDEVFGIMNRLQTRVKPEIYRQAGYARRAQGDEAAARELFTKAIELDPDGLFGSLARRALESGGDL